MPTLMSAERQPADTWNDVIEHVRGFGRLEADWNGYGAAAVPPEMIGWAVDCATHFLRDRFPVPDAIYPFPDGNVVFEWYEDKKLVRQIEVEGPGHGQAMSRQPDGGMAFEDVTWASGVLNATGRRQ